MAIKKVTEIFQYFVTYEKWYQISICLMKNVWFCFISIVWVHVRHKVEKFWIWIRWNTRRNNIEIIFLDNKYMVSDLNIFLEKISDFHLFPLFGFTLFKKLIKKSHWNTLIFFDKKKYYFRFDCLVKEYLIWFKLRFLGKTLAINRVIQIVNSISLA